jgi:hypothetical protein
LKKTAKDNRRKVTTYTEFSKSKNAEHPPASAITADLSWGSKTDLQPPSFEPLREQNYSTAFLRPSTKPLNCCICSGAICKL